MPLEQARQRLKIQEPWNHIRSQSARSMVTLVHTTRRRINSIRIGKMVLNYRVIAKIKANFTFKKTASIWRTTLPKWGKETVHWNTVNRLKRRTLALKTSAQWPHNNPWTLKMVHSTVQPCLLVNRKSMKQWRIWLCAKRLAWNQTLLSLIRNSWHTLTTWSL